MSLNRSLGVAAALVATVALFAPDPYGADPRGLGQLDVLTLAEWIRDGRDGLLVLDVRPQAAYDDFHIPRAVRWSPHGVPSEISPSTDVVVVYADSGERAIDTWAALRTRTDVEVRYLEGGIREWVTEVLNPRVREHASPDERRRFDRAAVLSRYFGGLPRVVSDENDPSSSTADLVERTRRRGCAF